MKILITGTSNFWTKDLLETAIKKSPFQVTKVVCGLGSGIEYGALMWCRYNQVVCVGFDLGPYKLLKDPHTARIIDMVAFSDGILIIDSKDGVEERRGLRIRAEAKRVNKPVYNFRYKREDWK